MSSIQITEEGSDED